MGGAVESPPQALPSRVALAVKTSRPALERVSMKPFIMNHEVGLWHINQVRSFLAPAAAAAAAAATRFLSMVPFVLSLSGCSTPAAQSCDHDPPASCPSPAPTFSAEGAPLIQKYCVHCHSAGGEESNRPLISYDDVTGPMDATAREVEHQLVACSPYGMPPEDQPQPTDDERQTIMAWISCGAHNDCRQGTWT